MNNDRIKELEEKIEDLKKRWPAHSTPPALLQELDELEDALAIEINNLAQRETDA